LNVAFSGIIASEVDISLSPGLMLIVITFIIGYNTISVNTVRNMYVSMFVANFFLSISPS